MKELIKSQIDYPSGLHERYYIQKIVKVKNEYFNPNQVINSRNQPYILKHKKVSHGSEYFVLRLDGGASDLNHVAACRIGIHAYACAIESTIPQLAKDLRERYPLISQP